MLKRIKTEPQDAEASSSKNPSPSNCTVNFGQKTPSQERSVLPEKISRSAIIQRSLECELVLFMSSGNITTNGLQYPPFKRLLTKFRPDFSLPPSGFNLDRCLTDVYFSVLFKMKEILANIDRCTLMISVVSLKHDTDSSVLCISVGFKLNGHFENMLLSVCSFDVNTSRGVCNLQPIVEQVGISLNSLSYLPLDTEEI
jgi:hypothetical protein